MIVLAPDSVQELADLTVEAFDLADRYRIVVMILGDGFLAQISEPLNLPRPSEERFDKSFWILDGARDREPRIIRSVRLRPERALEELNLKLQRKYREIEEREVRFEGYCCEDAEVLLVGFGMCARICRSAVEALRREGLQAGLFRPVTLWPFPSRALEEAVRGPGRKVGKILVVEMNAGQMLEDVRLALGRGEPEVDFTGRLGGMVPEAEEIVERVKSYEH